MHGKNITKLMLDIILTILFISLIYPRETGFEFHEIAGLSMGFLFTVHIVLNWSWFKSITKNLFNPRLKSKPKIFYVMDCVSFIAVATIIVTGTMISQVLFPSSDMISHTVVLIHKWTSYFCLVWFGLHFVLHWKFIVNTVPRLFQVPAKPIWGKTVMSLGAIILILGLLYSQIAVGDTEDASVANARREPLPSDSQYHHQQKPKDTSGSNNYSPLDQSEADQSNQNPIISEDNSSISDSDQESSIISGESSGTPGDQITLSDYLEKMFCNGCEKYCPLVALRCDRGLSQLEAAKQNYQAIYGSATLN